MHNDTVRQYLTSIKRLMTYKEEKMKNRHASEFPVCLHLIHVQNTHLQIAIWTLFSSITCILSSIQLVGNGEWKTVRKRSLNPPSSVTMSLGVHGDK